jgi:hypothetical protein
LSPHIVRSLSNIKIVKLWSGCTALHVVCIDSKPLMLKEPYKVPFIQ